MKAYLWGLYGTEIYLLFSGLSRRWRRFTLRVKGKSKASLQPISLPSVSWKRLTPRRFVKVWEPNKACGNIRISELGILNAIIAECEDIRIYWKKP